MQSAGGNWYSRMARQRARFEVRSSRRRMTSRCSSFRRCWSSGVHWSGSERCGGSSTGTELHAKKANQASEQERPRRPEPPRALARRTTELLSRAASIYQRDLGIGRHGRCRRGEILRSGLPHGHWKATTLVAGLRRNGWVAPMLLDGPINRNAFVAMFAR